MTTSLSAPGAGTILRRHGSSVARRIEECCSADLRDDFRADAVATLRRAVPFDGYQWTATDPTTCVGISSMLHLPGFDRSRLPMLLCAKYSTMLNRWTELHTGECASTLDASGGQPSRSALWRAAAAELRVVDIASTVLRDRHGCWGFLDLWRCDGRPFSAQERAFVAQLTPSLTLAHRLQIAGRFGQAEPPPVPGPVVMLLDDQLQLLGNTSAAGCHVAAAGVTADEVAPLPVALDLAAHLLACEHGIGCAPPRVRVPVAGGAWLVMSASRVGLPGGRPTTSAPIVVTAQSCVAVDRVDIFSRAYGLTRRETDVLVHLSTGEPTRHIARAMGMSAHTVQQHLKAMFTKTASSSRGELVARSCGAALTTAGDAASGDCFDVALAG